MSKVDLTGGTAISLFLGGIASIVMMIVWGGFWSGLTFSMLWGWFIAPVFALPALSIIQAYGIVLVYRCMRGIGQSKKEDSINFIAKAIFMPPFIASLLLGVGWVAKSFM